MYNHIDAWVSKVHLFVSLPQDIFSLGCVIAELFQDGRALFNLSQLLMYRRQQYEPDLTGVDPDVASLITHMIQVGNFGA